MFRAQIGVGLLLGVAGHVEPVAARRIEMHSATAFEQLVPTVEALIRFIPKQVLFIRARPNRAEKPGADQFHSVTRIVAFDVFQVEFVRKLAEFPQTGVHKSGPQFGPPQALELTRHLLHVKAQKRVSHFVEFEDGIGQVKGFLPLAAG